MKRAITSAALLALSLTVPVPASADLLDSVRSLADFNGLYDSLLDMAKTQNVTPRSYCESDGCETSVVVDIGEGHVAQISKITFTGEAGVSRLICFRNLDKAERQTCVNDHGRINVDKLTPDGPHPEKLLRLGWPKQ
jgi:hypothetical protein